MGAGHLAVTQGSEVPQTSTRTIAPSMGQAWSDEGLAAPSASPTPGGRAHTPWHAAPGHQADQSSRRPLPRELLLHVLSFLPPNDLALGGRLACKDAAQHFPAPQHATVRLGLPLPPHAVGTWQAAGREAMRQLPFRRKLRLLSTAAASGCEANLEVAWALLRRCLFPELLAPNIFYLKLYKDCGEADPGTAAASAGHAYVLPWLVSRRCPVDLESTLVAAARHCNLAGLQGTWRLLCGTGASGETPLALALGASLMEAAAESTTPSRDSIAKMQWVLDQLDGRSSSNNSSSSSMHCNGSGCGGSSDGAVRSRSSCVLSPSVAAAAARSGDLERLRWLVQRCGCPAEGLEVLGAAARHGDVAMLQWLVREAGCGARRTTDAVWRLVNMVCLPTDRVAGAQCLAKMGWLEQEWWDKGVGAGGGSGAGRGAGGVLGTAETRSSSGGGGLWANETFGSWAVAQAARTGRLELLEYLVEGRGAPLSPQAQVSAAASGDVPTARWLLARGCQPPEAAFAAAAGRGHAHVVAWLAEAAGCPFSRETLRNVVQVWPRSGAGDGASHGGRDGRHRGCGGPLLDAVRALHAAGCPVGVTSAELMGMAVWRGDLPLVRYLHGEMGCGLACGLVVGAAESGCEALMEWLADRGCTWRGMGGEEVQLYVEAGRRGDLATLQCLLRLGVPTDTQPVLLARCLYTLSPVLRWLAAHGAPVRWLGAALATERLARADRGPRDWEVVEEWVRWVPGGRSVLVRVVGRERVLGAVRMVRWGWCCVARVCGVAEVAWWGLPRVLGRRGPGHELEAE